jgi:two-component system chemotaxis response regulator CheB
MIEQPIDAVVIGASAGGVEALNTIFSSLVEPLPVPVMIVLHMDPNGSLVVDAFERKEGSQKIKEAEEKDALRTGTIYFAPPGYHLLVESDRTLSISVEEPVHFARPSIDVLFDSASDVFRDRLLGILLTGANDDGAAGLKRIHKRGGATVVQDPTTAKHETMPASALKLFKPTFTLDVGEIGPLLAALRAPRNIL